VRQITRGRREVFRKKQGGTERRVGIRLGYREARQPTERCSRPPRDAAGLQAARRVTEVQQTEKCSGAPGWGHRDVQRDSESCAKKTGASRDAVGCRKVQRDTERFSGSTEDTESAPENREP
jgi:hypothetical protein